jgi:hypothetical protein
MPTPATPGSTSDIADMARGAAELTRMTLRTCNPCGRCNKSARVVGFWSCRSRTDSVKSVGGRQCSKLQTGSKSSACPSSPAFC